jgi:hypothetical protein
VQPKPAAINRELEAGVIFGGCRGDMAKSLLCPWRRSRLVGVDLYSVFGALRECQRLLLGLILRHAATDVATKGAGVKKELRSLAIA